MLQKNQPHVFSVEYHARCILSENLQKIKYIIEFINQNIYKYVNFIYNKVRTNSNMGNNHHLLDTWSVKFVQSMDDKHFGNIDIYKNMEGQFIMCTRRTFLKTSNHKEDKRKLQLSQFIEYITHQSKLTDNNGQFSNYDKRENLGQIISPILHSNIVQENNLCIIYETYDIFTEYLNFTLDDMIKCKKQMDTEELWLCFKWALNMGILFIERQWDFIESGYLKQIFVTLQGLPIIYFQHLHKLGAGIEEQLLPASEQEQAKKMKLNRQSQIVREIALVILQLACMTHISKTENPSLFLRKCEKIDPKLGAILTEIMNHRDNKLALNSFLAKVNHFQENKDIIIASSIKLNKFRYAIPKPQNKVNEVQSSNNKQVLESYVSNNKGIRMLNGKKNSAKKLAYFQNNKNGGESPLIKYSSNQETKTENRYAQTDKSSQNSHQKNSDSMTNRKKILNALQNKNLQIVNNRLGGYESDMSAANNKISKNSSAMLTSLKQQMEAKKTEIQSQKQKINSRKQMILGSIVPNKENISNNPTPKSKEQNNRHRVYCNSFRKNDTILTNSKLSKGNRVSWSRKSSGKGTFDGQ